MVGRSWDVFQPLLFGLIGAEITVANLNPSTVGKNHIAPYHQDQRTLHCVDPVCSGFGLACVCIGLVIRVLVTFLLVHFGGFNLKEKLFIAVAWLPKATVQVCVWPTT